MSFSATKGNILQKRRFLQFLCSVPRCPRERRSPQTLIPLLQQSNGRSGMDRAPLFSYRDKRSCAGGLTRWLKTLI